MAEIVLSALLPVLFQKLADAALRTVARYKGFDAEIKKWKESLEDIQDVLADASQKEITNQRVKRWLNDLQHLAYDIDDVLDGLATEAMAREFNRESEAITSTVRRLIPTCCTNFSQRSRMHDKLDDITTRLQGLLEKKADLGLIVKEETRPRNNNNRRFQSSVVDPSGIVGRHAQKEELVHQLLQSGDGCDQNYSIVPIFGMGGVGKTTLAKLVYNEKKVKDHFELKTWVCVSDEFDSFRISKTIFKAVGGEANKKLDDVNEVQEALRDCLRGKRFLLVLDDVWTESHEDWKTLVTPFYTCAHGSKIIVTTRKRNLLQKLGYNPLNKQLGCLSDDDALSLFALHAFGVKNFDSHMSLKPHGEDIVKKCGGLPLALIALGTLLRTKEDKDSWKGVLESDIWELPDEGGIIPALKLSYYDLCAPLKQLFAYCSLFPKDFLFDKEEIILLWMAEGFLHLSIRSTSTKEILGHEFFEELLSRSFFQHAPNDESLFVMHDLMSDLATSVAADFFVRLDNENEKNIRTEMLEKYRHMSFVRERYVAYKKFEPFQRAKSLRTFLATSVSVVECYCNMSNKMLTYLLHDLPMLRVLCLSHSNISVVPESIGALRHLRYLNLSHTKITHLPETVCDLYNLETLILAGCWHLAKLPRNLLKLKNLHHLDIRDLNYLDHMPLGIGELKSLKTLSKIIVGGKKGFEMGELKELKNLCGEISIIGLDKVENATHARDANFSQKRFSKLTLEWGDELHGSRNEVLEKEVLNDLKPCNETLLNLTIRSYAGLKFPKWVGDPSFLHLNHVSVSYCRRCTTIPPFGQLPSLKELFINGLDGVEDVGLNLIGTGGAFLSLEILCLKSMRGWKKWSVNSGVVFPSLQQLLIHGCPKLVEVTLERKISSMTCGVVFPCLQLLSIHHCSNLVEVTLEPLTSLNVLEINDCPDLVEVTLDALPSLNVLTLSNCNSGLLRRLIEIALSVTKLKIQDISGLDDVVWRGVIQYLCAVEDLEINSCNEIRYLWESETVVSKVLMNLKNLKVYACSNLLSLGENKDNCRSNLLTSLRMLDVYSCDNMECCTCPDNIEMLSVSDCSSITTISIPTGGQKLKSLDIFNCEKLLEREWDGQSIPMLEYVWISDWPNLKSIIELNHLVHLTKMIILNCTSLDSFPGNELSNLTSLKELMIRDCPSMDASFPCGVWPPNLRSLVIGRLKKPISEWGTQNFPNSLVELKLWGGEDGVSSCSQLSNLLPSSLTDLKIDGFEKLESLSGGLQGLTSLQSLYFWGCPKLKKLSHPHPQHLTSLQHLVFGYCPNMKDLPELLLPSLLRLAICDCPNLRKRCSKGGCYWPLTSYIPDLDLGL